MATSSRAAASRGLRGSAPGSRRATSRRPSRRRAGAPRSRPSAAPARRSPPPTPSGSTGRSSASGDRSRRRGVHLRLGAGALLGAATDERTAASSMASVGPASEVHRLSAFYLAPEVRVGFAVTRHVELSLGVEMLAAFAPAPPRWSDTHDVIISRPAGGRGHLDYGTYPAGELHQPHPGVRPRPRGPVHVLSAARRSGPCAEHRRLPWLHAGCGSAARWRSSGRRPARAVQAPRCAWRSRGRPRGCWPRRALRGRSGGLRRAGRPRRDAAGKGARGALRFAIGPDLEVRRARGGHDRAGDPRLARGGVCPRRWILVLGRRRRWLRRVVDAGAGRGPARRAGGRVGDRRRRRAAAGRSGPTGRRARRREALHHRAGGVRGGRPAGRGGRLPRGGRAGGAVGRRRGARRCWWIRPGGG